MAIPIRICKEEKRKNQINIQNNNIDDEDDVEDIYTDKEQEMQKKIEQRNKMTEHTRSEIRSILYFINISC